MAVFKMLPPQPKQLLFFNADTRFVCYGGARGGGKTWSVYNKANLLCSNYPGILILLMRRSYPEVYNNFTIPLMKIFAQFPAAKYRESDKTFIYTNGSMIKLGYCDNDADALRYQGQQFDVIFIDEATQFPEMWFTWISGACRGVNAFPKRVYLTCNPGGIGHEWVKRLFIDKIYTEDEDPADYTFIQAKATDNYALKEADPGYLKWLDGLPEGLREAWRDGSWDIFAGQYFSEFSKPIHVIEPFVIPAHWKRYVSMDYGFGDMCAVLWEAIDEQGKVYVYREFCEKNVLPSAAAQRIKELSVNEKVIDFIAPPDLFAKMKDGGRSVAEQFGENGIYLTQASNRRADGWIAIKEQIKLIDTPDGGKTANLKIFTNCLNLITSLPKLQYDTDKLDGDIIAEHKYTHSPDALRYFCISHTSSAKPLPGEKPVYAFTFTMPAEEQPIDYGETIKAM